MSFALTSQPIDPHPSAGLDAAGGYVVFEGRVRNQNEGRQVESLEYEAFDQMAVKTGNAVLEEARARFSILDVQCVHRTGHLQIGDIAIRVEVASAHRKAAFEACDWIVDEVKRRVPIWKKEHYVDGDSGWINCESPAEQPSRSNESLYYTRQIRLKEVGLEGQAELKAARVLVVGAGGLGSSALLYLAAAGVGTLGFVEFDSLDESNLHRQVLYSAADAGHKKAEAAAARLRSLNPHISVIPINERLTADNAERLIEGFDIVLDCTDNFRTKFLLNDTCVTLGKVLIQASIYQYEGQVLVIQPGSPCLRCLWPQVPEEGCVGSCAEVGVLGVVPGVFGCLQAAEAIKTILQIESPLRSGKMMLFDVASCRQQLVGIQRDPECPICGSGTLETANEVDIEAQNLRLSDYLIIDVRERSEVDTEPLANSINLPTSRFDPARLPEADRYLLVCSHGIRSQHLARAMQEQGDRRFYSLVGGMTSLPKR